MENSQKIEVRLGREEGFEFDPRYFLQTAERAMRGDVVRGLVELITNADDSYGYLEENGIKVNGEILITIQRKRLGQISTITVLDRAEGMGLEEMVKKLKRVGGMTSRFMETKGKRTRGLMGRGSKECVVFGKLKFESIKNDRFAEVHLKRPATFVAVSDRKANGADRLKFGIPKGNGTLVTLEVESQFKIPIHESLVSNLPKYYSLRDIASFPARKLLLLDKGKHKGKPTHLVYKQKEGKVEVDEKFIVPGYQNAEAHLLIQKASERIKIENTPYWEGGILLQSGYAIHGITLFSRDIENNPHAENYFGRLRCPYIDELVMEYENLETEKKSHTTENPVRIIDPLREEGLVRDHPFTEALYREAALRLKELLKRDQEAEKQKTREIENKRTTERLKKLAGEVSKFIKERTEDVEIEDEFYLDASDIPAGGMAVIPGGGSIVIGGERKFFIYTRPLQGQEDKHAFISTESNALLLQTDIVGLIDRGDGVRCNSFSVKGVELTRDAKVKIVWEKITKYISTPVVSTEKELPEIKTDFSFEKTDYTLRENKGRSIYLFAKWPDFVHGDVVAKTTIDKDKFIKIIQDKVKLRVDPLKKLAVGILKIQGKTVGGPSIIKAHLLDKETATRVRVIPKKDMGKNIVIRVVDEDLGDQRAVWSGNLLKIAGRHKSIQRYLGPAEKGFLGQDSLHFRLLVAELIADNVARRILELNAQKNVREYEAMDITAFYRQHRKHTNDFLEIAHQIQISDNEINTITKKEAT